jgi:predicted RNA-binding Zn ribbon-like protein
MVSLPVGPGEGKIAAMREAKSDKPFLFVGNHLCLDFINTQMIVHGVLTDLLDDFSDLVAWLAQAGVLDKTEEREVMKTWGGQREGARTLEEARTFRGILRGMAERIVAGQPVSQPAVEAINRLLRQHVGYAQLVRVRGGFEQAFRSESRAATRLLVPLAESASRLLCAGDLSLVKRCQNPACILYFYDTTKNHARHWCSMSLCGNRMKVAAHYSRHRAKS